MPNPYKTHIRKTHIWFIANNYRFIQICHSKTHQSNTENARIPRMATKFLRTHHPRRRRIKCDSSIYNRQSAELGYRHGKSQFPKIHNLLIYNRYARLSTLYGANGKADRTDDRFDTGAGTSRKLDDIAHGINDSFYEMAAKFC